MLNRRFCLPVAAGFVSAAVVGVAACGTSTIAARRVVPDVVGKRVGAADAILAADGFAVTSVVSGVSVPLAAGSTLAAPIVRHRVPLAPKQLDRLVVCGSRPRATS